MSTWYPSLARWPDTLLVSSPFLSSLTHVALVLLHDTDFDLPSACLPHILHTFLFIILRYIFVTPPPKE